MLKDILKQRKISVYKLSKATNIPYTTLNELVLGKKNINDCSIKTIIPICKYLNVTVDDLINLNENRTVNNTWLSNKKKKYRFNAIVNTDSFDISRIHPLKQRQVLDIYNAISSDDRIHKVIIFGSSTNITCNIHSDIDIAIDLNKDCISNETKNEISELIQEKINYIADIIWLDKIQVNSNLYNNINRGVIIYEQVI